MSLGRSTRAGTGASIALALALVLVPAFVLGAAGGAGNGKPRPSPTPAATPSAPPGPTATPGTATPAPTASPGPTGGPGGGSVSGHVAVSAVTIRIEILPASRGKAPRALVTVTNQTSTGIVRVDVGLGSLEAGVVLKPAREQVLRQLGPRAAAGATWTACALAPGAYTLVATATAAGVSVSSPPQVWNAGSDAIC